MRDREPAQARARDRARDRRAAAAMLAVLSIVCLAPTGVAAPPGGSAATVDEVLVSGVRPGPRLWRIDHEGAILWILGTVTPLPIGLTWRSAEVEQLLSRTDAVLAAKPLEISVARAVWIMVTQRSLVMNTGGRRLQDLLPPDLYARFAAQRLACGARDDQWERDRPLIAGMLLEDEALKAHGLSSRLDVSLTVRRLARERHVRIHEVSIPNAPDLLRALKTVSAAAENRCLDALLRTVEEGLPALRERAAAWSSGDVERIRALPATASQRCGDLLGDQPPAGDLLAQIRGRWLEAVESQLAQGGRALAVIDLDLLLMRGGILDGLRAAGLAVDGP